MSYQVNQTVSLILALVLAVLHYTGHAEIPLWVILVVALFPLVFALAAVVVYLAILITVVALILSGVAVVFVIAFLVGLVRVVVKK